MEEQEFRRLVADYEHDSRHDPRGFAWRTAAMAVFGYAAILGTLLAAGLGLAWGVDQLATGHVRGWKVFLVIGCGSLLLSLLPAVWMRQGAPHGLVVTAREAPRLFELLRKLAKRIGAPRPDRVLLDGELNAAVVQQPRLGLLGWHRNDLILGLPLMMGLTTKQFAAVLAHEFGHLQGAHGKLGAWVYRTRRSWVMLAQARQSARWGGSLADAALVFFFRHFFPRFNARAFVLSRQQEVQADRVAHELVGAQPAAEGLIAIELQARWLDEVFWPQVYRRAVATPTPQRARPYREMRQMLPASVRHPRAASWLAAALKRLPDVGDTHPSLRDRVDLAGVKPALPGKPVASAADTLLLESVDTWLKRLDEGWRVEIAPAWSERHRYAQAQRHLVEELAAARQQGPIDPDDHLLWARAARLLDGEAAEQSVLRRLIADHPSQLGARHELGMLLVDSTDAATSLEGAELLRGVAEAGCNPWALSAAQRRETWLAAHDRFDELKTWRTLLRKREEEGEAAWNALHDFDGAQRFEASGLGRRALRPLQDLLRGEKAVGRAFVVRKTDASAADWRFCIVVIERSKVLGQPDPAHWWEDLRERIDLPCPFMVVDLAHPYWSASERAAVVRQMLDVPDACVYSGRRT